MALFNNKYRVESSRMKNWDYASRDVACNVSTICTKDRLHYFGEIKTGKMNYSPIGAIANVLWYEIKNHAKNIELGEYVVMPNHIHGILILRNNNDPNLETTNENPTDVVETLRAVETLHATSLRQSKFIPHKISPEKQVQSNELNLEGFQNLQGLAFLPGLFEELVKNLINKEKIIQIATILSIL